MAKRAINNGRFLCRTAPRMRVATCLLEQPGAVAAARMDAMDARTVTIRWLRDFGERWTWPRRGISVTLAVVWTTGAAAATAMAQGVLTEDLPGVATFGETDIASSSISLVALLVFASLVIFLALNRTNRSHPPFVSPIPVPIESGLRRAHRKLESLLMQARHR
jgi:hypothetical protein